MASLSHDNNGTWRLQFIDRAGNRRTVRLGEVTSAVAKSFKARVERLVQDIALGQPHDGELAAWLTKLDPKMQKRLHAAGLIRWVSLSPQELGPFIDELNKRTDIKQTSLDAYHCSRQRITAFFGERKLLRDIEVGDGERFRTFLKVDKGLSNATISSTITAARRFFNEAVRRKLIPENPFQHMKAGRLTNPERQEMVERWKIERVIDKCPNIEWKLIFALSRYGGLRCPSEHMRLKWSGVDWGENGHLHVYSPKTERYPGKDMRLVPLFPELRKYLEDAFHAAPEGAEYVFGPYLRNVENSHLNSQARNIVIRAGLVPWCKIFHNLRASRQTELTNIFPSHVVAAWMGNSVSVANAHYLMQTDQHWQQAVKQPTGPAGASDDTPKANAPPSAPPKSEIEENSEVLASSGRITYSNEGAGGVGTGQRGGESAGGGSGNAARPEHRGNECPPTPRPAGGDCDAACAASPSEPQKTPKAAHSGPESGDGIDRAFHASIDQILSLPLSKEEKAEAIRRLLAERGHARAQTGGQ